VSLPCPLARIVVLGTAVLAVLAGSIVVAGTASAHVTVGSQDAAPGGFGKITFRVPNESDVASTVGVRIQVPQDAAMTSLRTQPVPGWTVTLTSTDLPEPIRSGERDITSYVSIIEFRAQAGSGIAPGEFQEFALSGGPFPELDQLAFPTVQLYSDGSEAAWIEPSVEGQEEPDRPAPVLALTAGGTGTGTNPGAAATGQDPAVSHGAALDESPAGLALFLSILALLTGIAGVVLGWRANRRTVES